VRTRSTRWLRSATVTTTGTAAAGVARSGAVGDMFDAGVVEPVAVPARCLETAVRTASLVLRVDETLDAEPAGSGVAGDGHHGHAHGGDDSHTHESGHAHGSGGEHGSGGHDGGYPWALSH